MNNYDYFKKRCMYWYKRFGLVEWELYFKYKKINNWAGVRTDYISKQATITLGEDFDGTRKELDKTACEEVLHCMLNELQTMSEASTNKDLVTSELHKVINHIWYAVK